MQTTHQDRYCEKCSSLTSRGYCLEHDVTLQKQRQLKEFIRCIACVEENSKEAVPK